MKHTIHIRHLRGIKIGEIKSSEVTHMFKHTLHICHLRSIEIGKIKGSKIRHPVKHRACIPIQINFL